MDEASVIQKMQQVLDLLATDVGSLRSGKVAPSLVEAIVVSVYGGAQRLRINELANISTPDAQTLVIDPWDKSIIGDIKKGIEAANIGLTPSIDGEIIRIVVPPMTGEDREKFVKLLSIKVENGKVMLRQVRGDTMRDIKAAFEEKQITEDQKFAQEKKLQELTDDFVRKMDELAEKKKADLLQM